MRSIFVRRGWMGTRTALQGVHLKHFDAHLGGRDPRTPLPCERPLMPFLLPSCSFPCCWAWMLPMLMRLEPSLDIIIISPWCPDASNNSAAGLPHTTRVEGVKKRRKKQHRRLISPKLAMVKSLELLLLWAFISLGSKAEGRESLLVVIGARVQEPLGCKFPYISIERVVLLPGFCHFWSLAV